MKKFIPILKKCSLFHNINETDLIPMLGCLNARLQHYHKNQEILSAGTPARYFGIVLTGKVQIVQTDYYGNRHIIGHIGEAQLFGESFACSAIVNLPVTVSAICDTDVLLVDCQRILKTCNNACAFHNQIIYNLMQVLATKNLMFNQKLEIISKRSTREKLITFLLQEATRQNSDSFSIPYNRQELADYLGVDRSGLSSEIGKLVKEGLIKTNRNQFHILRFHLTLW